MVIAAAVCVFLASLYVLVLIVWGSRQMQDLAEISVQDGSCAPLVSIIVPACNEELTLEPALLSLVGQDYPNREIIVLDDRSIDGTYALLSRLSRQYPEIRIERITELPAGWLGKNHALYRGAQLSRGEILLFTDADVVMEASTVSRAAFRFIDHQLDHLTLIFRNTAQGGLLNAMVVDALGGLFLLFRPWQVSNPRSRAFIGVGAFNMISRSAYQQINGHAALKMHPIDDVMLGKKVKQSGLKQECLLGGDFVQVRWYGNLPEMVCGLMKNIFALYGFRVSYALCGISGIVLMTVLPPWGMVSSSGWVRIFFTLAVCCRLAVFACNAKTVQGRAGNILWSFVTPYLIIYTIIRSVRITLQHQGIDWRGTHYCLQELKEQQPLLTFFK